MRLRLFSIILLSAICFPAIAMPPPPPGTKFDKLAFYDGPGQFCAAVMSIKLRQGEFVVARRSNAWSVDYQIELEEGRLLLHNTTAGNSNGIFFKEVGEGRLLKTDLRGEKAYSYDNGIWGQSLFKNINFSSKSGKKLLDRIKFVSPKYSKVDEEACLKQVVIPD